MALTPSAFDSLKNFGRLAIPLSANVPSASWRPKPTGTEVTRGQVLAELWPSDVAAPLAPVDGVIAGVADVSVCFDRSAPAVLLEPKPDATCVAPTASDSPAIVHDLIRRLVDIKLPEGIAKLREHGVWAERWTTPHLLNQLNHCIQGSVDTVLCDALDESSDLLLHHRLAAEFPVELTAGILALASLTKAQRVWAVMAAYGDLPAWEAMRKASTGTRLRLVALEDHYPQSHPSLLIHEFTGRHIRPTRLAVESGVLVVGAPAAIAVGRCFLFDESMLSLPIGIFDSRRKKAHWLQVPLGTRWSAVLASLSLERGQVELRAGNPLRESRISPDAVIAGGELAVTAAPYEPFVNPDPCIRCAWCTEGCPVAIQPAGLLEAAQRQDKRLARRYGLDACIECGICSYVCPSHLPLLTAIRSMRRLTSGPE